MIMLRNSIVLYCAAIWLVACSDSVPIQGTPVAQRQLARIDAMPSLPQPLEIIDWHALAQAYDSTVDRKSTRLNFQSLMRISYAVFCLKKKKNKTYNQNTI